MNSFIDLSGAKAPEGQMELCKEVPNPSELFNSNIGVFWNQICQNYPTTDDSSEEIWESIKWTLSMSITTSKSYYDAVTIVGKYVYDESWTEAFATAKNAEQWKKNVINYIHVNSSKSYKVKIDIVGVKNQRTVKGDATITVTINWAP
jgi:hypothetical protein